MTRFKRFIKDSLPPQLYPITRSIYYFLRKNQEYILFGTPLREKILSKLLVSYYQSKFRRDWRYSGEQPHFSDFIATTTVFALDKNSFNPSTFYRAFYSSEMIRDNDKVLDIGCGDGFFTKKFYSFRASEVDAIDIEPSAIRTCKRKQSSPKINYFLMDAVKKDFPSAQYDVIVWDGAIGHFSATTTNFILEKISARLSSKGIFTGSESIGFEGNDHLQFFHQLEDFSILFKAHFKNVWLKKCTYPISQDFIRTEAYWRCSNNEIAIDEKSWTKF